MTLPGDEDTDIMVNAYLDGELDPLRALQFERRLAAEPALAQRLERLAALRAALRSDIDRDLPPERLRTWIETKVAPPRTSPRPPWRAMAASALVGAVLAGTTTFGLLRHGNGDAVAEAVVASHIRALMAPAPIDVASSDRHTVKPWFDGRLTFAPEVTDLGAEGFPLVGGRIDVVGLEAVPVLVYRAGKHLISVTEIPAEGNAGSAIGENSVHGFETRSWRKDGVIFWIVSDASDEALDSFVKLLSQTPPTPGQ
jgi:anti-sigma factor RsiW